MTYKPGQSGNPAGRPAGSKNKRSLIAREFEKAGSEVAKIVTEKAKAGDMRAIEVLLSRVEPTLKAEARRVEFQFDADASVGDQAKAVMASVADGQIDVETGRMLLDMLSALAGLRDVETFLAELKSLRGSQARIPGGVVTT